MAYGLIALWLAAALVSMAVAAPAVLLVDDFTQEGVSALGTPWRTLTDRVMGGISNGQARYETIDGKRCLRLQGVVSLENQGGFVQAAMPLVKAGGAFDAGSYEGIRLWVKGNGRRYYVHLRTEDTKLPWQYYAAGFDAGAAWEQVDIPFTAFAGENIGAALDTRKLKRLAIVAAKEAFTADVAVARIELYE